MKRSLIWKATTQTISKTWNLNGSKKEKIEKKNVKNKGPEDRIWRKISELRRDNGKLKKGN